MGSYEKLLLKWNDFQANISTAFRDLRVEGEFTDVTLVCEDNQRIEAHRVILSASSPFFRNILTSLKSPEPLVYMRGVSLNNLSSIIDFIYFGEANVCQDDLNDFLALADEVKLKGLSQHETVHSEVGDTEKLFIKQETKHGKKKKENRKASLGTEDYTNEVLTENLFTKDNETVLHPNADTSELSDIQDMDFTLNSMIENLNGTWTCKQCGKTAKDKTKIRQHVEVHIEGVQHPCAVCGRTYRSRNSLSNHKSKVHKNQ